ncbi:MAG: hypothetical protein IKF99_14145 [Oscillospiraceae bacterium]|nr:hypothetical protein [Oscillospiraceae bacterium]
MANWRRMAVLAGALLALWAMAMTGAWAEDAPQSALHIDFTAQPAMMVAPGDISMTFLIENRSNRPVQNIYLTSADGLLSEPIGQLGAGESQTLVRPHAVTQEELDAGQVVYTISHDPQESGGEKAVYTLSVPIIKGEQQPGVAFTRQFSSQYAMRDGLMTVTYRIVNTGNVPLSALRIRDSLGDFTGRMEQLDVGESRSFISRVTLAGDDLSVPVLEYAVPTGDEFSVSLDPAPIHIADDHLITSFYVRQAEFNEDIADAILILTNLGNVDYTNITVWDDVYGGVIADAISLPSGAHPVEIPYTYPLRGEGEYRWHITGANSAGQLLDLRTSTIVASNEPGTRQMDISLTAQTATPRINRPGHVTFDFTILNTGTVMARDARLYEVNRGDIRRLAVIPRGEREPTVFSASYDVSQDAEFIFCLEYTDAQGHQQAQTTSPIAVQIVPDGVDPQRLDASGGALEGESVKPGSNSATFVVLLIIAGAALTVMITILAVTSIRARRDRMRRMAAEKQRIKAELGRTGSFPAVKGGRPPRRNDRGNSKKSK